MMLASSLRPRGAALLLLVARATSGLPAALHPDAGGRPLMPEAGARPLVELPLTAPNASASSALRVHARTDEHHARIEQWRKMARTAQEQLALMGGKSNLTVLPMRGLARRREGEQELPSRVAHVVDGEREDLGAADDDHYDVVRDLKPRGREWRRQLAQRINEERKSKWREGEDALRASGRWQTPAGLAPAPPQRPGSLLGHPS